MRKLRVYLDTSVSSHLDQQDNPEYMQITKKFWEELKQEKYDVYISSTVITELNKCKEPKRSKLLEYMSQIKFVRLEVNYHPPIEAVACWQGRTAGELVFWQVVERGSCCCSGT